MATIDVCMNSEHELFCMSQNIARSFGVSAMDKDAQSSSVTDVVVSTTGMRHIYIYFITRRNLLNLPDS